MGAEFATTNQARFISNKGLTWQGLTFGTASELALAQSLDEAGIFFAPLCACRVTGDGGDRATRELDFLVVQRGVPIVIELDGAPHNGRAAEDHRRDRAIKRSGIWLVERFHSVEALQDPKRVVRTIEGIVEHYRKTA
ncbi:MAG: DUF559 domain-containing protein [Betaproteobacteria bacterium]